MACFVPCLSSEDKNILKVTVHDSENITLGVCIAIYDLMLCNLRHLIIFYKERMLGLCIFLHDVVICEFRCQMEVWERIACTLRVCIVASQVTKIQCNN